jgi:hypothetical protein
MLGSSSIFLFLAEQAGVYLPEQFFEDPGSYHSKTRVLWIKMEAKVPFGITQSTLSAESRDVFL